MPLSLTFYTVGHGNRTLNELLELLQSKGVDILVDIRSTPNSEAFPHFCEAPVRGACERAGVGYHWAGRQLGGKRLPKPRSRHTAIDDDGLRAFADYMDSEEFKIGLRQLVGLGENGVTAILCAERRPERCHRSLIADALMLRGATVVHLLDEQEVAIHQLNENLRRDVIEPVYDRHPPKKALH